MNRIDDLRPAKPSTFLHFSWWQRSVIGDGTRVFQNTAPMHKTRLTVAAAPSGRHARDPARHVARASNQQLELSPLGVKHGRTGANSRGAYART